MPSDQPDCAVGNDNYVSALKPAWPPRAGTQGVVRRCNAEFGEIENFLLAPHKEYLPPLH
jgi:hypothetical protein